MVFHRENKNHFSFFAYVDFQFPISVELFIKVIFIFNSVIFLLWTSCARTFRPVMCVLPIFVFHVRMQTAASVRCWLILFRSFVATIWIFFFHLKRKKRVKNQVMLFVGVQMPSLKSLCSFLIGFKWKTVGSNSSRSNV